MGTATGLDGQIELDRLRRRLHSPAPAITHTVATPEFINSLDDRRFDRGRGIGAREHAPVACQQLWIIPSQEFHEVLLRPRLEIHDVGPEKTGASLSSRRDGAL